MMRWKVLKGMLRHYEFFQGDNFVKMEHQPLAVHCKLVGGLTPSRKYTLRMYWKTAAGTSTGPLP